MAFAQRIITSNSAGDQEFTFTFDYIKEEHIKVFVNFVEKAQGTGSNEFQVITNTTPKKISLNTGLAADNTRVEIRRVSSLSTPLVDFEDGSTLTAADLDTAEKQSLFIAQELDDALKQGISIDTSTGIPTLGSQRLSNVADPVNAQDVVTKAYLERSGSISSTQILDGTIVNGDIANATITGAKLVDNTVTATQIAANAVGTSELADNAVNISALQDGSVTSAKIANDQINSQHYVDQSIDEVHLNNNIIGSAKIIDGAVITTKISNNGVTNAKLAPDSVTNAKIADNSIDSEHYVDGSIDTEHIADDAVTNAKIADDAIGGGQLATGAVTLTKIGIGAVNDDRLASNSVTTAKIANNAVTTDKIQDAELTTLAGMQSGTASKLADSTALTADIADLNQLDGMAKQTTITNSDSHFPTSGAVVDFVANQIAPVGGLEVIADEDSFPATQPVSGVVISISNADGLVINSSGVATNARTLGNGSDNVTINNFPASLRNKTLSNNLGLLVSSTGASQEYNYHKLLAKETDVLQLSDDINDFNARYRVGSTNPTSDNDAGDLFFNDSTQKLLVYNGTSNAWEEAQSVGNFFISTLSPAFNGSVQDFTITNAPTNAQQIILSINGVIQKPNAGTSTPSEGFALSGSTVKLAAAPASGSDYFAIVLGSAVNIGTPSNNTVTSAILQNGSVIEAKLGSGAVTRTKLNLVSTSSAPGLEIKGDGSSDGYLQLNCSQNSHGIKLKSPPHSASQSYTLTFPSNIVSGQFLTTDANGNLSWAAVVTDLVNDTSPQLGGDLDTNSHHILLDDDHNLKFGNDTDLEIFHQNSDDTNIINSHKLLKLFSNGNTELRTNNNDLMIKAQKQGAVELYYNNSKKAFTGSTGFNVDGNCDLVNDNNKLQLGNNADLQLYHNGNNSFIENYTGNLHIKGKNGEESIIAIPDGAVELYHNNGKRVETTANGIELGLSQGSHPAGGFGGGYYSDIIINNCATSSGSGGGSGVVLLSGNASWGGFIFADPQEDQAAYIKYSHNADIMYFGVDGSDRAYLENNGFKPSSDNTYDLGDSSYRWRNLYTTDLNLSNEGSSNDVDGTWGSYTIQEGADDLFLINKRNGKKYKFNLTEVN